MTDARDPMFGPLTHGSLTLLGEYIATARRTLCAFHWREGVFSAAPQLPFQPRGLVVEPGEHSDALLSAIIIGRNYQANVTTAPIPVRWFAEGQTFARIAAMLDEGKELPSWVEWDRVEVGQEIQIRIVTRFTGRALEPGDGVDVLMWGWAIVQP